MKELIFKIDTNIVKKLQTYSDYTATLKCDAHIVTTPRLKLQVFHQDDLNNYYELFSNKNAMKSYAKGEIRNKKQVDEFMKYYQDLSKNCYFTIFCRKTADFIGIVFLTPRNQKPDELLLGYIIKPRFWGNNYTKESVFILLYCLAPIIWPNCKKILATCRQDNITSHKILQSFGFKAKERKEKFGLTTTLYQLSTQLLFPN